jgi:hypothetical protein
MRDISKGDMMLSFVTPYTVLTTQITFIGGKLTKDN